MGLQSTLNPHETRLDPFLLVQMLSPESGSIVVKNKPLMLTGALEDFLKAQFLCRARTFGKGTMARDLSRLNLVITLLKLKTLPPFSPLDVPSFSATQQEGKLYGSNDQFRGRPGHTCDGKWMAVRDKWRPRWQIYFDINLLLYRGAKRIK